MDADDLKNHARKHPAPAGTKKRQAPSKRYARRIEGATRDAMLTVKLTPAELATLKSTAIDRHGWLVSEYVRNLVNADQVGAIDWPEAATRIQRSTLGRASIRLRSVKGAS